MQFLSNYFTPMANIYIQYKSIQYQPIADSEGEGTPLQVRKKRSVSNFAICSYLVVANTQIFLGSSSKLTSLKVAYTSGPIFEKIMKRYPIFSVQKIDHQIDQKHK